MRILAAGILRVLADAVFPPRCRVCGTFLAPARLGCREESVPDRFDASFAGLLCGDCLGGLTPIRSPICSRCGTMFDGSEGDDHLCGRCLQRPPGFFRARAAGVYDKTLLALVHGFKYRARTELAMPLAALMQEALHRFWGPGEIDAVVAVPLHFRRLRRRGFNQAALLARRLKSASGERYLPVLAGALIRRRPTAAQTGLGRRARLANIRGAFAVGRGVAVAGMHLLLVDDVLTTGATANECSRVLTAAGAARVDVLTLARAVAQDGIGRSSDRRPAMDRRGMFP